MSGKNQELCGKCYGFHNTEDCQDEVRVAHSLQRPCSPAPACDADTAERELCEALDKIYKLYGSLGAFFDELQKRRPVQENEKGQP